MKIIANLLLFGCFSAAAAPEPNWQATQAMQREAELQRQQAEILYAPPDRHTPPRDLWREINGVTYCIAGPGWKDYFFPDVKGQWEMRGQKLVLAAGWFEFGGKVIEVQPRGIRIRGYSNFWLGGPETTFFVMHYPYEVAEGSQILHQAARDAGTYTYSTVSGSTSTLKCFDYGLVSQPPAPPPPTLEEINAAREQAAKKKTHAAEGALRFNQELAEKGDSYGQLRMGERYRDGDGVPRDLQKARDWFAKAAAQGDKAAASELAALPEK
jgi:hypothetical protein